MKKNILLLLALVALTSEAFAQVKTNSDYYNQLNTLTTAVPFLLIAPDARGGGMGDAGVASSPDANSQHWNAAKYAFY